jgi:hypothetical protein
VTALVCPQGHDLDEGLTYCPVHTLPGRPAGEASDGAVAACAAPDATVPDGAAGRAPAPRPAGGPGGDGEPEARRCLKCGTPAADPRNTQCLVCHEPLTPPDVTLDFGAAGRISLRRGHSTLLGRDPDAAEYHAIFAGHLYVSGRHATLGVDDDGRPWIRDERSLNGTYVNGRAVPADRRTYLEDLAEVRLASDLAARVVIPRKAC